MTKKSEQLARQLAKKIVEVENKIQKIIDENSAEFDVFRDEEENWCVQTSYCQMGGCVDGYIPAKSKQEAQRLAAEMTFKGLTPSYQGLCSSCSSDLLKMQI